MDVITKNTPGPQMTWEWVTMSNNAQRGKYKKVRNQPSVAPMLNATTSAKSVSSAISCDSLRSASNPQETNGLVSKKGEGKPETQLEILHKTIHVH